MKLVTKEILSKFIKNPIGSHDGEMYDAEVLVKFFNPYGAGTWLITEAEQLEDGDWMMYGYIHILEWEWGYVLLSEIQNTLVRVFGCRLPLERDMHIGEHPKVKDLI